MVEPGRLVELDFAVFAQLFREPLRDAPGTIHDLLHVRDADAGWHDRLPLLYSFLAFAHHERMSLRERKQLMVAVSEDVCWDGEPIPGAWGPVRLPVDGWSREGLKAAPPGPEHELPVLDVNGQALGEAPLLAEIPSVRLSTASGSWTSRWPPSSSR
jgi:hypothetical protein